MQNQEFVDTGLLEKIKRFGTPHPNRYITLWDRFVAGIIDTSILMAILMPIHFFIYEKWLLTNILIVYVWEIISEFIFYGYIVFMHGRFGRTIGKKAMGLKILDVAEQKEIGYRQAIIRDIVPIVGVAVLCISKIMSYSKIRLESTEFVETASAVLSLLWFVAEIGTAALNKKRRALHDYLASTVVVKL